MISLVTNCDDCIHEKVCSYKNNAKHDMNKLSSAIYGKGPNDDYDWATMMKSRHVAITFSCLDFYSKGVFR